MPSSSLDYPLIIGDEKKLLIRVTKGQGPLRPPLGPDGKGRPRYIQVDQAGQRVEGVCYVGKKAENGVRLQVVITGQSMRTMFIGAHPAIMESNTILKKRITLFPPPTSSEPVQSPPSTGDPLDPLDSVPPSNTNKGKDRAIPTSSSSSSTTNKSNLIPLESEYPFSFEFPRFCMESGADGSVLEEDSDDENGANDTATSSSFNPDVKRSAFVRKLSTGFGLGGTSTGPASGTSGSEASPTRRSSLAAYRTNSRTNSTSFATPAPVAPSSSFTNSPSFLSRSITPEASSYPIGSSSTPNSNPNAEVPPGATGRAGPRRTSSTFGFSSGSSFAAMGGLLGRSGSTSAVPTVSSPGLAFSSGPPGLTSSRNLPNEHSRRESDVTVSATYPINESRRDSNGGTRRPSLARSFGSGPTVGGREEIDERGSQIRTRYHLPPSCNMLIGTVQTEIHYEIKFKLKRKGWRLNDTWIVRCVHFPKSRIPYERIPFQPSHPGWQTVSLPGGAAKKDVGEKDKGKRRASDAGVTKPGIKADIFVPSPLLVMIPRAAVQETAPPPSIPFRLHFSSSLPFPLLSFASTEASQWRISLVRETRLVLHSKEEIRYSVLRGTWSLSRDPMSGFAVGSPNQAENIDLTRVHTGSLGLSSFPEDEEVPGYDDPAPSSPLSPGPTSNLTRLDTQESTRSSEEVHVFGQEMELEESSEDRASLAALAAADRDPETGSSTDNRPGPTSTPASVSSFNRRLPIDDVFFDEDDQDTAWTEGDAPPPRADSPPPGFDQTQYAPTLATMPPLPPPPPPAFRPKPIQSLGDEAPQMDTEEHVYLDGTLTLFRTAYKAVYQPFKSRQVKIRYWLEVTIEPKPGPVAEAFENVKGRVEAFVVRQGRAE